MRTRRQTRNNKIIPATLHEKFERLVHKLFAYGLLAVGGASLLALITFAPNDPSWNTAAADAPSNLFGYAGSYYSDIILQLVGLSAGFLSFALIAWGAQRLNGEVMSHMAFRIASTIFSLIFLSTALAHFPTLSAWPLGSSFGGVLGDLAYTFSAGFLAKKWGMVAQFGTFGVFFGLFVGAFLYGTGINPIQLWNSLKKGSAIFKKLPSITLPSASLPTLPFAKKDPVDPTTVPINVSFDDDEIPEFDDEVYQVSPSDDKTFGEESTAFESVDLPPSHIAYEADFALPEYDLLDATQVKKSKGVSQKILDENAQKLESVLEEFGIRGEISDVRPGPVVTLYELKPAAGIKTSRVIGLADDIARSMSALSARIAVIPGRNVIGIELPNSTRETVFMRELLSTEVFEKNSSSLPLILGKDIGGLPIVADLAKMPHLLVAGTTGSGKSVAINTMILSLLFRFSPEQCKFIMVDPKMLELSIYDDIPHLLTPVVTDPKRAVVALKWVVREMEDRYRSMAKMGVRNIMGYNTRVKEAQESGEIPMRRIQTGFDPESGKPIFENQPLNLEELPYIVVVVDEMADLMLVAGKEIEANVQRLAQMARAAGIHLIMATQRPSVDVITGTIKANFPTRISFQVSSKIDSRTILGEQGAEQLLGQGDMLYMAGGGRIQRVHGPFVRDDEVEKVVKHLKMQGEPSYVTNVTEDTDGGFSEGSDGANQGDQLYQDALNLILSERKASTSFIQRHLQIGYNRAARLMDQLEKEGVVSSANHVGKREILREA